MGAEALGVDADAVVPRGEWSARETVGVLLKSIAAPHEGQNRLSSGVWRLHAEQIMETQCNTHKIPSRRNFVPTLTFARRLLAAVGCEPAKIIYFLVEPVFCGALANIVSRF